MGEYMSIQGVVNRGVIVLDQPAPWPEGTRVDVSVKSAETRTTGDAKASLSERLMKHAGTVGDLPTDLAAQHDHYIHGTPKR